MSRILKFLSLILSIVFIGCARYSEMVVMPNYGTNKDSLEVQTFKTVDYEVTIDVGYNIFISYLGIDQNQLSLISKAGRLSSSLNEPDVFVQSYTVDSKGFVTLPLMGQVYILHKTLEEATKIIQEKVSEFFKEVSVEVRLMSYEITIFGEVKRPSLYTFYKDKVNIFDVIAKSGGFSTHAKTSNILLIRTASDSTKETIRLDLTDEKILSSPYFWIKPNDVVYVKPMRSKPLSVNNPSLAIIFSSLTTLLWVLTFYIPSK